MRLLCAITTVSSSSPIGASLAAGDRFRPAACKDGPLTDQRDDYGTGISGPAKTYLSSKIGISSDAPRRALRRDSMVAGNEMAGNRGGTMNYHVTRGIRGPLGRIGRRVAVIVAECNYAQTRVTSLRNTPERFWPRGN